MRLWSLESYKCIEEYSIPDGVPLVDFDFDESKVTCRSTSFLQVSYVYGTWFAQPVFIQVHDTEEKGSHSLY